jgi:putative tricarboxylic transport membrane protein
MAKLNVLYGALIGSLAALFFYSTTAFPERQRGWNPRIFPRFICICTFALSVMLIVRGIREWHANKEESQQKEQRKLDRKQVQRILTLFAVGILYVLLISWFGYLWITPLFIAGTILCFKERRVLRIVVVSVLTTVVLFFVFRIVFKVPLPTWSF